MKFAVFVILCAAVGCAGTESGTEACAFDVRATYTVTAVPDGRPQVGTLGGLLGPCQSGAWVAECSGEALSFTCGAVAFTYRVASADGLTARLEKNDGTFLTLQLVEGGS